MVRRAKSTTKKKTAKRVVKKKKAPARSKQSSAKNGTQLNQKAQWMAYRELQQQVDKAWNRLKADVKKKASPQILVRDKNALLLLLGECNYMARECMRLSDKKKR
jgi:hypothetical protein